MQLRTAVLNLLDCSVLLMQEGEGGEQGRVIWVLCREAGAMSGRWGYTKHRGARGGAGAVALSLVSCLTCPRALGWGTSRQGTGAAVGRVKPYHPKP